MALRYPITAKLVPISLFGARQLLNMFCGLGKRVKCIKPLNVQYLSLQLSYISIEMINKPFSIKCPGWATVRMLSAVEGVSLLLL